jgi:regulator of sigma E protease
MAVTMNLQLLVVILEVAFGLGMVIFVHELGHFAVAKWCGVKVEKFYLGFDIYGLKLLKFVRGETEYGIGILPLGGYVKMLGQDDNPSRAAGERERSILRAPDGRPTPVTSSDTLDAEGERYQLDPRSYMAKSVPQRMAIISAGVIMNLIFAVLVATIAYLIGVKDIACGISAVYPGEAAWRSDLQPGDTIVQINHSGDRPLRFRDLMNAVALADMNEGIDFQIRRETVADPFWINVKPDLDTRRLRPTIGVVQPLTTHLRDTQAVFEGSPAAKTGKFEPGDRIAAIDDRDIKQYSDYEAALARDPAATLKVKVVRSKADVEDRDDVDDETFEVEVPSRPVRTLGLVMKLGKIAAVQADSPAAKADLRPDDFITSIDGQPPADPMQLADAMRRRAGETVRLGISRRGPSGADETLEKQITLRQPLWTEESDAPGSPLGIPALGIAVRVLNIVHEAQKGSPAAAAELVDGEKPASVPLLAAGDEIVEAQMILPTRSQQEKDEIEKKHEATVVKEPPAVKFSAEQPNWPFFFNQLQWLPAGSSVKLTLKDGRTTTVALTDASDWCYPNRGLIPAMEFTTAKAGSLGEAAAMGARETVETVVGVYAFLRKIGSQISPYMLGGPKTIAEAAGGAAYRGFSDLLIFLTMLSANLAVINFLPIPLLDGGHMVFLALEGILRRPVSERVVVAFHYLGFLFIISLMMFVLGLDFGLIPRPH